jgi:hypothetical protein
VISTNFKEISIKGIDAIPDSTISVYNEYGIKLSGLIDINKAYTCELVIPLKYISRLTGTTATFTYNLKLNGIKSDEVVMKDSPTNRPTGALIRMGGVAVGDGVTVVGTVRSVYGASPMELMNPTDFSGTYTLVKK